MTIILFTDIWFRMYYGDPAFDTNLVGFNDDSDESEERLVAFNAPFEISCDIERHPPILNEQFIMEQRPAPGGAWGEFRVPVTNGYSYRCGYRDAATPANNANSAYMTLTDG